MKMVKLFENYFFDMEKCGFYRDRDGKNPVRDDKGRAVALTLREKEVFLFILDEYSKGTVFTSRDTIKDHLNISHGTIRSHIHNINVKFNRQMQVVSDKDRMIFGSADGSGYQISQRFADGCDADLRVSQTLGQDMVRMDKENAGPCLASNIPGPKGCFVGRRKELDAIDREFFGDGGAGIPVNRLFLHGISGIGKSELARQYAMESRKHGHFDRIIYGMYDGSLTGMVQSCIKIPSVVGTWREKLDIFLQLCERDICGEPRILLVIDNFNAGPDSLPYEDRECWDMLCTAYCKCLITSTVLWEDEAVLEVGRLDEDESLLMFEKYARFHYGADERDAVRDILQEADRHTLAVEIIAKTLRGERIKKNMKPSDMLLRIRKQGMAGINSNGEGFSLLLGLFDKADFSRDAKKILYCSLLFPVSGILRSLFAGDFFTRVPYPFSDWNEDALAELADSGWLDFSGGDLPGLHPMIAEIIAASLSKEPPEVQDGLLYGFLSGFISVLGVWKLFLDEEDRQEEGFQEQCDGSVNQEYAKDAVSDYEQMLVNFDWFTDYCRKIADRIVKYDVRCPEGPFFIHTLCSLVRQYLHFDYEPDGYRRYLLSMNNHLRSSGSPEAEALYQFDQAATCFGNYVSYAGSSDYECGRSESGKKECSTWMLEGGALERDDFMQGLGHLRNFYKLYENIDPQLLPLTDKDIHQLERYDFDTYEDYLDKRERISLERHLQLRSRDGLETEEHILADWHYNRGRENACRAASESSFVKAENCFLEALRYIDMPGYRESSWICWDDDSRDTLEMKVLEAFGTLCFDYGKYGKGIKYLQRFLDLSIETYPEDHARIGEAYLKLGCCQACAEVPLAGETLEAAYAHLTEAFPPAGVFDMGGQHRIVFQSLFFLFAYYKDVSPDEAMARKYYDLAVSYPIKVFRLFGILWEHRNEPVSHLVENWDEWSKLLCQDDPDGMEEIQEIVIALAEYR